MSLVGLALRMSAVRSLEASGAFPAGRVYDSAFLPVDQVVGSDPTPFAIVSTETASSSPSGRDVNNGERELELIIEIALTRPISVSVPDGEDRVDVEIVETDAGLEASLAILERQAMSCLFGRGGGAWGDAFRALCSQVSETISRRGVSAKEGARFAARQMLLQLRPIAEPPFAAALDAESPMATFLALAEGEAETEALARALREAIEGVPQDWPSIYTATAVLGGYSEAEAEAIGIRLLEPDEDPELVTEITVSGEGWEPFAIDEETAEANDPEEPDQ